MTTTTSNITHVKEILNHIPTEEFQLVKIFNNMEFSRNISHVSNVFSNGVAVVQNNKLAGRLEDIKFLESLEPESRKQFLKEGKILSAMHHKNIPQVYDMMEYEDLLLFRYEHVEGYSLKEVLEYLRRKNQAFPTYVATSITVKILNALNYAHNEVKYDGLKKSIIHCDIKPSNIILCAKDYKRKGGVDDKFIRLIRCNKVEPFLIDFGIAKFSGKADMDGTINYLSPEQVSKHRLDWRSDTYQILLVYYEMLTLIQPYANLSRSRILEEKLKHDFSLNKKGNINSSIKEFIEKGTKREISKSFKTEKECIRTLTRIESRQKRLEFFNKYRKPIIGTSIILLVILLSITAYKIWDYKTQSIDAIIHGIENNPNPSLEQLETATARLQARAFEKKYYEPLIKGEFRDAKTGKPLYPSHLDSKGNWILVGPETESAGMFVGLLFDYTDKYPKLLKYAKEYAEPILNSEFDGSSEKRYMYALIPGYEKTHDERYLKKLVNVSDILMYYYTVESGTTQCNDMYQEKLFMYVYNKTRDKRYLDFYDSVVSAFVKNNIDSDGYIYSSVDFEVLTDGAIHYSMWGRLASPALTYPIGSFFENTDEKEFKNVTSLFSRDFVEVLNTLHEMYKVTNDNNYLVALNLSKNYYILNTPQDKIDYFFVSAVRFENNIPKDTLAAVKSLYFFKDDDVKLNNSIYAEKLKELLSKEYFRDENEVGILAGSVFIENMRYDNSDLNLRNQSLIETDALFLEFK